MAAPFRHNTNYRDVRHISMHQKPGRQRNEDFRGTIGLGRGTLFKPESGIFGTPLACMQGNDRSLRKVLPPWMISEQH